MSLPHQRFTIFAADDATPILGTVDGSGNVTVPTCTTDPAGARPFMIRMTDQSESAIDLIEGTSLTGQGSVALLDKRITASDQTTGWFTAILADATTKQNQLVGHRILIEQQYTDGTWYTIMDGVIGDITLQSDLVSYQLAVRDMRDRERKVRCFTKCSGLSIYPRGFINGYGKFGADGVMSDYAFLSLPAGTAKATFHMDPSGAGHVGLAVLDTSAPAIDIDYLAELQEVTAAVQVFKSASTFAGSAGRYNTGSLLALAFSNIKVYWRARGSTGAFTVLSDMPSLPSSLYSSNLSAFTANIAKLWLSGWVSGNYGVIMSNATGAGLPADGQLIDLLIEYVGPPNEKYPLYIEKPFGQLLKDVYDSVYSDEPTRIRYNATTVGALVTRLGYARVKITAPEDDVRAWTETAIYKPNFLAPSIDSKGRISPVSGVLPDAGVSTFALDDTNIVRDGSGWVHSSENIVNKIVVKYVREYLLAPGSYNAGITTSIGEREVEFTDIHPSIETNGDHSVEYEPGTLRSMGNPVTGNALNGFTSDEAGPKLAQARAHDMFDRFAYGAPLITIKAQRHDTAVAAAQVGDWATIGSSWMPNYNSGKRGINRLAQVISIKDIDPSSRLFTLLDGGPNASPVGQPTLGTLTTSGFSMVIPIATIPTGVYANVEYAVSPTLPGSTSSSWVFAGRIDVVGSVTTPVLAPGTTVWVRVRGTGENKRPSAWAYSSSIVVGASPYVMDLRVEIPDGSDPILYWTNPSVTLGLRIGYAKQDMSLLNTTMPTAFTSFGDVDATTGQVTLTGVSVNQFERLQVNVVAYSGFATGVATGTAGVAKVVTTSRISQSVVWPTLREVTSEDGVTGTLVLTPNDPQHRLILVEAAVTQSDGTFGSYATVTKSSGVYTVTVPMRDKQPSRIMYRGTAITGLNQTAFVVEELVRFAIGSRPAPPEVSYQIGSDGTFTVTSKGDSDTNLHQVVVKLDVAPTAEEINAATGSDNSFVGRTAIYTFKDSGAVQKLTPGQKFYVGVRAYNTGMPGGSLDAKGSDVVSQTDQWITPSGASAAVTVASVGIDSTSITLNGIALSALTSYVDIYVKEYRSDPGSATNIVAIGHAVVGSPLSQSGSLVVPVANPSNYFIFTLRAVDSINRVGSGSNSWDGTGTCPTTGTINIKVRAAASAQPAPNPPTALALTAPTTDSVNLAITMPASSLPATLRIFRDGSALPDVTRTAGASAVQNFVDTGRTPGATYTYQVYGVNSSGVLSATGSPIQSITLTASTIPTPSVSVGAYSNPSGGYQVTITPGAGSPGGETWTIEHQTDIVDGTTGSRLGYGSFSTAESNTALVILHAHGRGAQSKWDRVRVTGSKSGWTSSAASSVSSEVFIAHF